MLTWILLLLLTYIAGALATLYVLIRCRVRDEAFLVMGPVFWPLALPASLVTAAASRVVDLAHEHNRYNEKDMLP